MLTIESWATVYKALADKTRLHILALLKHNELCVCELVAALQMTQPAISQHLRKLRQAGLVKERKTAHWVFYSIDGAAISIFEQFMDELPDMMDGIKRVQEQGLRINCQTARKK